MREMKDGWTETEVRGQRSESDKHRKNTRGQGRAQEF